MKKIYFILFLGLLLSCTQTHKNAPLQPVKVTVPAELQAYYQGVDFNKTGKALYDELATLTIAKHTNFLSYKDRHKYLYKADASKKNPENVGSTQGTSGFGKNMKEINVIHQLRSTPSIFTQNQKLLLRRLLTYIT